MILFGASTFGQSDQASEDWRTVHSDVVYGHKAGMALTYDVITPVKEKSNGAGVLFMVSGGWNSRWSNPNYVVREKPPVNKNMFEKLVQAGFTVYMVRHGSAPRFKVPEAVSDVRKAVRHIRYNAKSYAVDPNRIGVCGGSAGGHLSLMLGTTGKAGKEKPQRERDAGTQVAAVVAYFPPTNLEGLMNDRELVRRFPALDFDEDRASSVSPIKQVTSDDAPTLLIHGNKDRLVQLSHSRNIKKVFDEKHVENELIVIEGAGHGFRGENQQRAEKALVEWFEKYLTEGESESGQGNR